jgi:signal transduction histidine kinase
MPCGGAVTIDVRNVVLETQPGLADAAGVMLSVSDSGSGMSESTCKLVFTPFFTT